jgi:hypothetical protein
MAPSSDARVPDLYRRLVLLVGVQLLLGALMMATDTSPLALLALAAGFVATVWVAVTTYQLMSALDSSVAALWAVGVFVPLVNLLVLLAASGQAQKWCRARGIPIGLLGPARG